MRAVFRRIVPVATFGLLLVSFGISIAWLADTPPGQGRFEPLVESIGFCGALIGVFADRYTVRQERRHQTLLGITGELVENAGILDASAFSEPLRQAGRPLIYPRLRMSAADAAVATGALVELADDRLVQLVHAWRDAVLDFNHRLDLTELRSFVVGAPDETRALHFRMTRDGGPLDRLREQCEELTAHLRSRYGGEEAVRGALGEHVRPGPGELGPPA